MSGLVHWFCPDNPIPKAGYGTAEAGALVSASIEAVTCSKCRDELSRRLRVALSAGDSRWLGVDWGNTSSVRDWVETLWTVNWRLHAEAKELREQIATLTGNKVEGLQRRLIKAALKERFETQLVQPDPECAGCKRWTHRIKTLEERVEYARKVLEGR